MPLLCQSQCGTHRTLISIKLPLFLQTPICILCRFYQGFERIRVELCLHFSGKDIISVENWMRFFLKVHVIHVIAAIALSSANPCAHSPTLH